MGVGNRRVLSHVCQIHILKSFLLAVFVGFTQFRDLNFAGDPLSQSSVNYSHRKTRISVVTVTLNKQYVIAIVPFWCTSVLVLPT